MTRTHDLLITNQLLYRLSYASKVRFSDRKRYCSIKENASQQEFLPEKREFHAEKTEAAEHNYGLYKHVTKRIRAIKVTLDLVFFLCEKLSKRGFFASKKEEKEKEKALHNQRK